MGGETLSSDFDFQIRYIPRKNQRYSSKIWETSVSILDRLSKLFASFKNPPIYFLQVVIEGVAGVTLASNIALDDLNFSTNLTCVSAGELSPQETFQGKVFFTGHYPCTCTFVLGYALYNRRNPYPKDQGRGCSKQPRIRQNFYLSFVTFR